MIGSSTIGRLTVALTAAFTVAGAAAVLAANTRPADPGEPVAIIDRAQGEAHLERNGLFLPVQSGQPIARRDHVATGPGGRVQLTFNDGSRLLLGENALVVVADFIAEEGRKTGALILDLVRGAMRLNAARPVRAPDKRIEVRTSVAVISSQGADLWSGPLDGQLGILLLAGKLDVRNDAGWVILDRRRLGTTVSQRMVAPQRPSVWSAESTTRSLTMVAFK